MTYKPSSLQICGPYKGDATRPIVYHVKAVYSHENEGYTLSAPLFTVGRRTHAIKMAKSVRGRKKWGRIPIFMRWAFDNTLELINDSTGTTMRQGVTC